MNFSGGAPAGWTPFLRHGNSLQFGNGGMQLGQVDSYGGIYKPVDFSNTSKVSVEYDGNIANVYWGQWTSSYVAQNPTSFSTNFAMIQGLKNGYGENASRFMMYNVGSTSTAPASYIESKSTPALFGDYHFVNTYMDGQLSMTVTPIGNPGSIVYQGSLNAPTFDLQGMSHMGLFAGTTTGTPAYIRNVSITTTTAAPICTSPEVLQNDLCVTPPPTNPFLSTTAKTIYSLYPSLWKKVGEHLTVFGDALSIVGSFASPVNVGEAAAKVAKVVLNRVWMVALDTLTQFSSDPRDDKVLALAKTLKTLERGLSSMEELLANTSGNPVDALLLELKVATAMSKLAVTALENISVELANDPPRSDFDLVRVPLSSLPIALLPTDSNVNILINAQREIVACSNDAIDGLQVALLAAERAWGARIANNSGAVQVQAGAYEAGVTKANSAMVQCEAVFALLPSLIASVDFPNVDGGIFPGNASLDAVSVTTIRQALVEIGEFSDAEIDAALVAALADPSVSQFGTLFDELADVNTAFSYMRSIDPRLGVAEIGSVWLALIACLALMLVQRNQNKRFGPTTLLS